MRAYYLLPESTAQRVLKGIKPRCVNPAAPGFNDPSSFNPQPSHTHHVSGSEHIPTSASPAVSPRGATPSAPTGLNPSSRSMKKKTYRKKKISRTGVYKTTKLPPVQLRATSVREKIISSNPEISNLIPLYVKNNNVSYVKMLLERIKDNPIVKWDSRGNLLSSARSSNILDMLNLLSNSSQNPTVAEFADIKNIVNATGILPSEIRNSRVRQKIRGSGFAKQSSLATYGWVPY